MNTQPSQKFLDPDNISITIKDCGKWLTSPKTTTCKKSPSKNFIYPETNDPLIRDSNVQHYYTDDGKCMITKIPSEIIISKSCSKECNDDYEENYEETEYEEDCKKVVKCKDDESTDFIKTTTDQVLQRIKMKDMWFVYICLMVLYLLFILVCAYGINSQWFKSLQRMNINPYIIGILWAIVALLAFIAIYMLWKKVDRNKVSLDLMVSIFYLISAFLSLTWAVVFYQIQNIIAGFWIALVLFTYQVWLFSYVFTIKWSAGLFLLPSVILHGYLLYSMIHIASLNGYII